MNLLLAAPGIFILSFVIGLATPHNAPFSKNLSFGCFEYKKQMSCLQITSAIFIWIISVLLIFPLGYALGSELKD